MNQPNLDRRTLQAFKAAALGSVVFFSISGFPLTQEILSSGLSGMISAFASVFIMGLFYAMIFGKGRTLFVYLSSLALTGLGMIIRYVIEFGEVSNTMNFTLTNILVYIGAVPILVTLIYLVAVQILKARV
ncbi:MAG: hypothetical protein GX833_07840 [Clostridium sp.]|jgi:hypothetical protein|nr:hypothetical protein [Clostridium sp.]